MAAAKRNNSKDKALELNMHTLGWILLILGAFHFINLLGNRRYIEAAITFVIWILLANLMRNEINGKIWLVKQKIEELRK